VWDGQGFKDPCFFGTFSRIKKSERKVYFMRKKLDSLKDNFLKEFFEFLTLKTF
jgi:hypothetical protein